MTEYAPKPENQPYEYRAGSQYLAYEKNGKKLYVTHGLGDRMKIPRPVATWVGPDAAEVDGSAFEILRNACGGRGEGFDKERFERYLDAIIEFETKYSDNQERHERRLPIEEEILKVLTEGGYFNQ